jgi:hypothetical protein
MLLLHNYYNLFIYIILDIILRINYFKFQQLILKHNIFI